MEKIMQSLINNWIRGVDTYTHNGSTWLIFTDSKRWVIELTEDKTLWYNYNFFKQIFSLTSLDVVENQQYITKWVEDNVMNKVKDTRLEINITEGEVDDIIQDGVKKIRKAYMKTDWSVEDTIENGVKETDYKSLLKRGSIEDTIENGVKETKISPTHTEYGDWLDGDERLDEIIQNGVKETQFNSYENKSWVEGVIKGGVKETIECDWNISKYVINEVISEGVKETLNTEYMLQVMVEDAIQNGVKKTSPLDPSFSTRFIDGDENNDWELVPNINEVIENGVKETKTIGKESPNYPKTVINHIINNGVKVSGTFVGGKRQKEDVESVIGYGTKNPTD
jgi:hypothetical protein